MSTVSQSETLKEKSFLERIFKIKERGSTVRTEILAGFTIFIAMSYILVVHPSIMEAAGMPFAAVAAGTAIVCGLASIFMGLYANYPVALAPSLGINAFIAYKLCATNGMPWEVALGAVFISGVIFIILTVTKIRQLIIEAVPSSMKYAIVIGIGLFIAFIGLEEAGIVVSNEATFVALGNLKSVDVLVSIIGLCITSFLYIKNVRGSMLIGILATTVVAMAFGIVEIPSSIGQLFTLKPATPGPIFAKLDIIGAFNMGIVSLILSFTLLAMFDCLGTLMGVCSKAGFIKKDGKIDGIDKALTADSVSTTVGSLFGGTIVTAYVESTIGVAEGGRTGLTAVVAGLFFFLALFCTPLLALIPVQATAPVLILIGLLMVEEISHIDFTNFVEGLPAFLTIILMPLTFSIADAVAVGFVAYVVLNLLAGKAKEVHPVMYVLAVLFIGNIIFGTVLH